MSTAIHTKERTTVQEEVEQNFILFQATVVYS